MIVAETSSVSSEQLNDLLINVGRSLLQYTSESWPWTAVGEEVTHETLDRLAAEQRDVVAALTNLLTDRGEVIDFGSYPTDYTSLHYVDVDYLLSQLVLNQQAIVDQCDSITRQSNDGDTDHSLLSDITLSERKHLEELESLQASR